MERATSRVKNLVVPQCRTSRSPESASNALPPVCLDRYVDWTCISAPGTGQERETGHARGTGPEARPFPAAFEVERCVDWQAERGMGAGTGQETRPAFCLTPPETRIRLLVADAGWVI